MVERPLGTSELGIRWGDSKTLAKLQLVALGLGGRILAACHLHMARDAAFSGLPDLLALRAVRGGKRVPVEAFEALTAQPSTGLREACEFQAMFVEVKTKKDRLMPNQRGWLAHFVDYDVPAKVYKLLPPLPASAE